MTLEVKLWIALAEVALLLILCIVKDVQISRLKKEIRFLRHAKIKTMTLDDADAKRIAGALRVLFGAEKPSEEKEDKDGK